jgi:peroxiredoxin (alkyl hydroperoxide reductase subunit C)
MDVIKPTTTTPLILNLPATVECYTPNVYGDVIEWFIRTIKNRNTVLLGASTDSEFVHLAWRLNNADLNDISFPMIADTSKSLAEELGILEAHEKIAYRATFIIDPQGIIRWVSVYDLSVGRNVNEVIRVLDALQTDELTPCGWQKGEATLTA